MKNTIHNKARQKAIEALGIIETPAEEQYDNITSLAAYICDVPIAMISFIHGEEQWIKSKVGTDLETTPLKSSFCAYTIAQGDGILEIQDTRQDERFSNLPAVTTKKQPFLFYAGFPLKDHNSTVVGTLCLLDYKPRRLCAEQRQALLTLGNQVENLLELKQKNQVLEDSKTDLKKHNNLLKDFAGAVSHDLKMPLASIVMTIDVLKSKYAKQLDEQGINYLDRLKQSSLGMSDYITNILAYYETENVSSEDYAEMPFGLKEFLESIIDMLNIDSNCEINLPDKNFEMICNRSGLEQIFLNLLGNSLKYNDKKETIIDIEGQEKENCYYFQVTDNGMGIPKEQQTKIFDLFSIATDRDRHGKKGNGIGLSTVYRLVHKLGGEIKVDSQVGEYTRFSFSIEKQKPKKTA